MADTEILARLAAAEHELAELKGRLGHQPAGLAPRAPQLDATVHTNRPGPEPYAYDPRHDPRYTAAVMAGASNQELAQIEAGVRRDIDARPHPGPVSQADIRRRERQLNAAGQADLHTVVNGLTMPPLQPGAQVSRSASGQMTIREAAPVCCTAGHPRSSPGDWCPACGGRMRTAEEQRAAEELREAAAMREEAAAAARIAALEDGSPLTVRPARKAGAR